MLLKILPLLRFQGMKYISSYLCDVSISDTLIAINLHTNLVEVNHVSSLVNTSSFDYEQFLIIF